jgi:hypothetical protein
MAVTIDYTARNVKVWTKLMAGVGLSLSLVSCASAHDAVVSTTVTVTTAVQAPAVAEQTVDQAIATTSTDWLVRLKRAGHLGRFGLNWVNGKAFYLCHELERGIDYETTIDHVMINSGMTRTETLALYSAAVGFDDTTHGEHCSPPPGIPPGMP